MIKIGGGSEPSAAEESLRCPREAGGLLSKLVGLRYRQGWPVRRGGARSVGQEEC